MFYRSRSGGFTLVELLVVVSILAILSAVAVPNYLESQTRAKIARTSADIRTAALAIEMYQSDNNSLPLNGVLNASGTVERPQTTNTPGPVHKFLLSTVTTPVAYISSLPKDPFVDAGTVRKEWKPVYTQYFYTNFAWYTKITQPNPPAVIATKEKRYGTWVVCGAGPDRDRLDLSRDLVYDPTNGTVSDGDVIRGRKFPQ